MGASVIADSLCLVFRKKGHWGRLHVQGGIRCRVPDGGFQQEELAEALVSSRNEGGEEINLQTALRESTREPWRTDAQLDLEL